MGVIYTILEWKYIFIPIFFLIVFLIIGVIKNVKKSEN